METAKSSGWLLILVAFAMGLLVVSCGSEPPGQDVDPSDSASVAETEADEPDVDEHHDEHEDEHHDDEHHDDDEHTSEAEMLALPALAAAELNGVPLQVVASTSIIGDVVARVGGEVIDLTVLMGPGQDPHSYEPAAKDLRTVSRAQAIFVNGWNLEESLVDDLETIGEDAPVIPISANIEPLAFGEDAHGHDEGEDHEDGEEHGEGDEHGHSGADPHVWFSIQHVEQWVENVENSLNELDPTNAAVYGANAAAYLADLGELEGYAVEQLNQVPEANRFLVTNHDAFGYLAQDYDLTVLGTVIPSMSTLAEPSASDLADLITTMEEHAVCTVFTETTVSDALAQTVAAEVSGCSDVQVLKLYTGAVGAEGSGADSYIGMYRANVDTVVAGLK